MSNGRSQARCWLWKTRCGRKDVIVDAIFGTGVTRPLEGVFLEAVKGINRSRSRRHSATSTPYIVSLDLPSGPSTRKCKSNRRCSASGPDAHLQVQKPANVLPPASHYSGRLIVASIGTPESLLKGAQPGLFPDRGSGPRACETNALFSTGVLQEHTGHALVIAGSRRMTGAAVLCQQCRDGSQALGS